MDTLNSIGTEGIDTAKSITSDSFEVVSTVSKNTSRTISSVTDTTKIITGDVLDTSKKLAKDGLENLQKVTTSSLQLTGNSLQALFGTMNNVVERQNGHAKSISDAAKITNKQEVYNLLRKNAIDTFIKNINDFITNFKMMVTNQQKMVNGIINIFQLNNCEKGKIFGFYCSKDMNERIEKFKTGVQSFNLNSSGNVLNLKGLIIQGRSNTIISTNVLPDKYSEQINLKLSNLCNVASKIFTDTLNEFTELSNSLKNEKPPDSSSGGRKRKTEKRKKRYARRKQSRKRRSN